jgi:hypothetical protein
VKVKVGEGLLHKLHRDLLQQAPLMVYSFISTRQFSWLQVANYFVCLHFSSGSRRYDRLAALQHGRENNHKAFWSLPLCDCDHVGVCQWHLQQLGLQSEVSCPEPEAIEQLQSLQASCLVHSSGNVSMACKF